MNRGKVETQRLQLAGALKPGELAERMKLPSSVAWRIARMEGAPLVDQARPVLFSPLDVVLDWIGRRSATPLGSQTWHTRTIAGTWLVFARDGWAALPCRVAWSHHPPSPRARALGDYVLARFEETGAGPGVVVRCWCSARCGSIVPALVPEDQRKLLKREGVTA